MKKVSLFLMFLFVLGLILCYYFGVLPIIRENSLINSFDSSSIDLQRGDRFDLFDGYNFDGGKFSMYIVFSGSEKVRFSRVLFTNKKTVLNQVKEYFNFTYTGGDIATCESYLYLKQGDKIALKVGIAFDQKAVGVQSEKYGWLEMNDIGKLRGVLMQFESAYYPVIEL